MKIVFITPISLREWGGVENYIFDMANLLSKKYHVLVLSNGIISQKKRITELPHHSFCYKELPTFAVKFITPSLILPRLPEWINRYEFAYLYHSSISYSYLTLLTLKLPTVLGVHYDILATFNSQHYPRKMILTSFKMLAKHAAGISCRTEYYASLLRKNLGIDMEKIFINPVFVDTNIFKPRQKRHFTVLFAGRLAKDKGIETILDVIHRLGEDIHWLFLGSGEKKYETMLEKISKKKPNVVWKGFVPTTELAEELAKSSLTVIASRGGEGYSNVALQSLACGTPVILSRIPVFSELASKLPNGVCSLFQPGNSHELLNKILIWKNLVETDEKGYREICAKARRYIKEFFSPYVAQKRFEYMINRVISARG